MTRDLPADEVTAIAGIPVTTMARTLVDLADETSAGELANIMHEAAYRGILDLDDLERIAARYPTRRGADRLRAAIAMHRSGSAGTRSALEDAFLDLVAAHVPAPAINSRLEIRDPGTGRGIEVDFVWHDKRVVVEIDGPGHERPRTRRRDAQRDRALSDGAFTVIRFTADDVHRRPELVVQRVTAALTR